ncbi:hypothetical protein H0H93_008106 [Arthromyces matolae]|nr:hypothetical protein H0H93_008106 [Arthromyces matolae]
MAIDTSGPSSHSSQKSYFDAYPKAKYSPNNRSSKGHRSSLSSKTILRAETSIPSLQDSYTFPIFDSTEDVGITNTPTQHPRPRSRTGPSSRSYCEASVPQLRFSGSSSTQQTETPLHTPVDFNRSRDSFENFPVVVAAPVAGVETMDALVDGMNGGEDVLSHAESISGRSRFGIPGHHPLYQPPLPTPPPGVVLGGGKARRSKRHQNLDESSESDEDKPVSTIRPRPRRNHTSSSQVQPSLKTPHTAKPTPSTLKQKSSFTARPISPNTSTDKEKAVVPSISEIIRTHAPPEVQVRSRPSTSRSSSYYTPSHGHTINESEPESNSVADEASLVSRSSIDSVADEVQRTIRSQLLSRPRPPPPPPPSSFLNRQSSLSDNVSMHSPRSDPGAASIYSYSTCSNPYPSSPLDVSSFVSLSKPATSSHEVAKYLRSARLTTLLSLTRSPHASADSPLTVSLSDLGSSTGHPILIFLGLGCVRHIMGLYDEMAEILNLRLITIDRWGLGRTDPRSKSSRGVMQWASVVEEVLDILQIGQCSVMAHSAGAPYALSFANRAPERIKGPICLLAPWVGGSENNGYKWLKYVPNGILKTAQAAEWKIQAWMIGKPPTIAFEGIGYNAPHSEKSSSERRPSTKSMSTLGPLRSPVHDPRPRPSIGSSTFSDYDDLRDFDGRFESRSTLGAGAPRSSLQVHGPGDGRLVNKRKTSRSFLDRLKGSPSSPQSPSEEKPSTGGKKLKALRSMGSLKGKSTKKKPETVSPRLPPSPQIEVGLGLDGFSWPQASSDDLMPSSDEPTNAGRTNPRNTTRRSISFTSPSGTISIPSSPLFNTDNSSYTSNVGLNNAHQAALGNALIAASHAESAKGTHNDLLQILNHDNQPWGFSYSAYPHCVQVWYGDRDERIAEHAVRWMAGVMGETKCSVKVVKGADHGLMYRSSVVVDVLETMQAFWKSED